MNVHNFIKVKAKPNLERKSEFPRPDKFTSCGKHVPTLH